MGHHIPLCCPHANMFVVYYSACLQHVGLRGIASTAACSEVSRSQSLDTATSSLSSLRVPCMWVGGWVSGRVKGCARASKEGQKILPGDNIGRLIARARQH